MNQPDTPQFFKSLQILFLVLFAGQALFGGLVWWFMNQQTGTQNGGMLDGNAILAVIIVGWMAFSSFFLYHRRTATGRALQTLSAKLTHYRMSCLFRWIMLEFANLLVIFIAFIERNTTILVYFTIGLLVFLTTRPTQERFENDYQING